jgi:uncharacterized protein YbjQ (UPF0145 family)
MLGADAIISTSYMRIAAFMLMAVANGTTVKLTKPSRKQ